MASRSQDAAAAASPGIRTQAELARAAGLSRYTVNRALRGLDDVSDKTRDRVLQIARDSGYRVHSAASAMVKQRFNSVALIQSNVAHRSNLFSGSLFKGVHDALAAHDIHVVVSNMSDDTLLADGEFPKVLRQLMCDGVLLNYFAQIPPQLEQVMRRTRVAAIWMNTRRKSNCVYLDDVLAGREATEHLLELGHRRIAYLDYENHVLKPIHHSINDRYAGYCEAMLAAGLTPRRLRPHNDSMKRAERMSYTLDWLSRDDCPTAVVCYSDKSTLPLLAAACERRLRIPEDLSLVNFGEDSYTPIGQHITTWRHDWHRVGKTAADRLREMVKSRDIQPSLDPVVLPFIREPGDSTKPPASVNSFEREA